MKRLEVTTTHVLEVLEGKMTRGQIASALEQQHGREPDPARLGRALDALCKIQTVRRTVIPIEQPDGRHTKATLYSTWQDSTPIVQLDSLPW